MSMTGRALAWLGCLVALGGVLTLCALFAIMGLDEASELAGVVTVFATLAGLGVSVYGLVLARRSTSPSRFLEPAPNTSGFRAAAEGGGQSVIDSQNIGTLTQISSVNGDVNISR